MKRTLILLLTAVVWCSVAARSSSASLPTAGDATAFGCAPTGTCQVTQKFAVVSPATFDVGDRDLEVTSSGGLIGDGSVGIVITGATVTLDKGSVVSNNGAAGNPAGNITIDTSAASTPGACTINRKLTVTSPAGSGSDGGTVSLNCVGIALGAASSIESKGDVTSGSNAGGTIELQAETGSLTALKGAKLNAQGNTGGQIDLTSGGNCNPLDASMLADGKINGDVGTGGQVTITCAGNIGLPKEAKIVAGSDKTGTAGSVTIEADGQCAGNNTITCQTNDPCIGSGTCEENTANNGTCHVTTSQTCGPTSACPHEKCVNLVGQCSSDSSACQADTNCSTVCDKTDGTCSITTDQSCTADGNCPSGETCEGICSDGSPCDSDSPCGPFTCDNLQGNCSVTTDDTCSSDSECPTEACDTGRCSGVPIACQVASDCDTCQLMGACSDGSQCLTQSGCSSGPCLLPGHCSSTTSRSCTADSDCPTTETCVAQVQIAKGALIQNDGGTSDPTTHVTDLSAAGPCNINGKLTSDSKPFDKTAGGGAPPGTISFRCAGLTLGSKAVVESTNVGDAGGNVVVDTSDGSVSGIGDPSQTAAPCDLSGTIKVTTSAIVDPNNGSFAGQGGSVAVDCGTTLNVSASIDASGTGGDGLGTDSGGGSVSLVADTGAATINGKVLAKGKGVSGAISVQALGVTIGRKSNLDASGNSPGDPFGDGLNISLSSTLSDGTTTSGDIDIFGKLAAKGTGADNQGGSISVEGCSVTSEPKSTVISDGTTGGTNSLTAHKTLSIGGKMSAVASGSNDLVYGSGSAPAAGTVKPPAIPTMTTFSDDECP